MPYTFEVEKMDGYILLTASGELESIEDLTLLDRSLHEVSALFDCRRLLIDERACTKHLTPHDFIVFSESKMGEPRMWKRMAVVYTPENVAELRWIETVLQNRFVAYRQFSSVDEAERWLMSDAETKPRP